MNPSLKYSSYLLQHKLLFLSAFITNYKQTTNVSNIPLLDFSDWPKNVDGFIIKNISYSKD